MPRIRPQRQRVCALMFLLSTAPLCRELHGQIAAPGSEMVLDGTWDGGLDRKYDHKFRVPGLAEDPANASAGTLWYRHTVHLPDGNWDRATLLLGGARFAPTVYVNGKEVSRSGGGMAPTAHLLRSPAIKPGADVELEVALTSENALDPRDASMVPAADRWRSDNSSGLWDSVRLHFSSGTELLRLTPYTNWAARKLTVHWMADTGGTAMRRVQVTLLDQSGTVMATSDQIAAEGKQGSVSLNLGEKIEMWSPMHPKVYRLRLVLTDKSQTLDSQEISWGFKNFTTANKRFMLNGEPIELRGGTVVWHRFLRNPQAEEIAWNTEWFRVNVMQRLKGYGANYLRFHLGLPPEALLDVCDREGLMVQLEWPFFHGVKASDASMREQWHEWIDVAMRHPSVVILHPWNETNGDELTAAWSAMDAVLLDYPPLVVAHRDTLHIHKYWWSLFENLGLYYDSADQFDKTIMVDEFGGDYLDQNGNAGLYPATKETFLRFLGRIQTREERLYFEAEANGRVAEYWRRIGAAGFAPFCIMSSPQDGNSWFLGDMRHLQPMPVWDALSAAFSPQSISLDVWDRNYMPGETINVPLYFFNDTSNSATLTAEVQVLDHVTADHRIRSTQTVVQMVDAHGRMQTSVKITLPQEPGNWRLQAVLQNHVEGVEHPIISAWDVRTLIPQVPARLASATVGLPVNETELRAMLEREHIKTVAIDDPRATVIATSAKSWGGIDHTELRHILNTAVGRGQSVVMLDIGPKDLGQAGKKGDLGPLDGAPRVLPGDAYLKTQQLFAGIEVQFLQVAEPESHIQPGPKDDSLWENLPRQATWLWNGLRGGLIAPAAEMEISGLGAEGFLAEWVQRGADAKPIRDGGYYAYRLAAYYAFSTKPNDALTIKALRDKVKFLVEDAPALQDVVDPNAKIEQTDLSAEYRKHIGGNAEQLIPLSTCGKNLTRTDVAEITFGAHKGNVILSQVMTAGRLQVGETEPGFYGLRYDPAAEQFVLNALAKALQPAVPVTDPLIAARTGK
jgi:beta-galactosidase